MKAPQPQNKNIILLNEDVLDNNHGGVGEIFYNFKDNDVSDKWIAESKLSPDQKTSKADKDKRMWFSSTTIQANKHNTVFVFGANIRHFQNRTDYTGNSGQAHEDAIGNNPNTFPINTMNENGAEETEYMKKATKYLTEFVKAGGRVVFPVKVVFPVNNNGSTIGTGIAASEVHALAGKGYADALAAGLQNIQVVGNPTEVEVNNAMNKYITRMDALEIEYKKDKQTKPGKKENHQSKEGGRVVKMQKKIVNKWLDDEAILKILRLTDLEKNNEDNLMENPLVNIKDVIVREVLDEILAVQEDDSQEGNNYLRNLPQSLKVEMKAFNAANRNQNTFTKIVSNGGVDKGGDHWFTIHINKAERTVQVVDSLASNLSDNELFNILKDKHKDLGFSDEDKLSWGDNGEVMKSAIQQLAMSNNKEWRDLIRKADEERKKKQTSSYEQEILNIVNSVGVEHQAKKPPKWLIKQDNDYDCSLCSIVNYYFLKNPDKTEFTINSPDGYKGTPWMVRFVLTKGNGKKADTQAEAIGMNCYISYNKKQEKLVPMAKNGDMKNILPEEASDLLRSAIMVEDIISRESSSGSSSGSSSESSSGSSSESSSESSSGSSSGSSGGSGGGSSSESSSESSSGSSSGSSSEVGGGSVVTIETDYTSSGDGDDEFNDEIYHPDGLGEGAGNLDIDADFTKLPNIDGVKNWAKKREFYHKEILKPKKFQIGAYFKSLPKTATQGKVAQYLSIIALPITATLSGISGLIGGGFFNPIYIASRHDAWTGIPDYNTASPDFDGNKLEIQRCVTGVLELLDTGCHSKKIEDLRNSNPPIKIETQEALGNMVNLLAYKSSEHNLELAMRHSTDDSEKNKLIGYKNIMTKIMTEKKWTMGSSGDLKDFNAKDMRNLVNVISGGDDKHPLMDLINKIENASDQRITKKLKEKFTHMVLHYSNSYSNSLATKYGINNQTVSISDMALNAGFNLALIIPRLKSMSMDPVVSQYINPDSLNLLKDYIKSDKRCQKAQRIAQPIHTSVDAKTAIDGVKGGLDKKIKACDNRVKFLQTQTNGVKPEVQSMIDKINHKKESLKQSKEKLDIIDTKDDLQQWFIGYSEDIANQRYNYKVNEKKPQLNGVKSLQIKAKVYEDGESYEEKERKAIKAENDRREIITSYRFIEDANILDNGDIKDVGKAAIELNNFINICEEELKKIPKDNDSADHAWLTVKREGDQNSVKASNEDAREKITKRLEIAEIFYELFSQASTNTTGEEMNLNKVEKEVIQNAISCKDELLVVKENDNGEEDKYAISKSAHAIFNKIDDIQKKMPESSHKHHEDESHSHGDDSSRRNGYMDDVYSQNNNVRNAVARRLELAGYQKEFDGLNKVGKSKSISGGSRGGV